jgi:hypothetical protein
VASSEGPVTAAYRAAAEARRLEHSWIGPEHVLLALFAEPSPAAEALEELGATRERVEERARSLGGADPPPPAFVPGPVPAIDPPPYRWLSEEPPRRARVDAEEGVDLDAALATARDHGDS